MVASGAVIDGIILKMHLMALITIHFALMGLVGVDDIAIYIHESHTVRSQFNQGGVASMTAQAFSCNGFLVLFTAGLSGMHFNEHGFFMAGQVTVFDKLHFFLNGTEEALKICNVRVGRFHAAQAGLG